MGPVRRKKKERERKKEKRGVAAPGHVPSGRAQQLGGEGRRKGKEKKGKAHSAAILPLLLSHRATT